MKTRNMKRIKVIFPSEKQRPEFAEHNRKIGLQYDTVYTAWDGRDFGGDPHIFLDVSGQDVPGWITKVVMAPLSEFKSGGMRLVE